MTSPESPADALVIRPRRGTVALLDRSAITVAELSLLPQGVRVHRWVVSRNGHDDLVYFDHDPGSMVAALARVLREHGLPRRLACVGLPDAAFGTVLAPLPRTTPAATAALVARRVREEAVAPETDLQADHALIEPEAPAAGAPRLAWISWAPRPLLDAFAAGFRRERLAVDRVLPPSVALLDLFGRIRPVATGRFELLLRYAYPSLVIGVHDGRAPVYLRVLRDVMSDATEGVTGTVLREVLNTVAYTIENHQGRMVQRVSHSGLPAAEAARLAARLNEQAGLAAEPLAVPVLEAPPDVPAETLASLTALLLHGAPLPGWRVRAMDLLPAPVPRVARSVVALAALACVSVVAGVTSLLLAQATVRAGQREVAALETEYAGVSGGAATRAAQLERAGALPARSATLARLADRPGNPVQPLLEALLLLPPEAALKAAALDAPPDGSTPARLDLRLSADFSGPQGAAQRAALQAALATRPWCAGLHVAQGGLRAGADGPRETLDLGSWLR